MFTLRKDPVPQNGFQVFVNVYGHLFNAYGLYRDSYPWLWHTVYDVIVTMNAEHRVLVPRSSDVDGCKHTAGDDVTYRLSVCLSQTFLWQHNLLISNDELNNINQ